MVAEIYMEGLVKEYSSILSLFRSILKEDQV